MQLKFTIMIQKNNNFGESKSSIPLSVLYFIFHKSKFATCLLISLIPNFMPSLLYLPKKAKIKIKINKN